MDMPNFTKAHHFSINGGNFGTVNGGVNNYTLTSSQSLPAHLGLDSIAAGLLSAPPNHNQGSGLGANATIHSVPSTPATSSANLSPTASTIGSSSPANTISTISAGSDSDSSSQRSSGTPPTGMGEHRHNGASPSRPPPAQQNLNLLTPLTDSLDLRRFTPHQATQEAIAEVPESPQFTDQLSTPSLPPLPSLPPTDFSSYRTTPISPTGFDSAFPTSQSPPIPPYPQNSPPSFDSSPLSPRAAQNPADLEDPSAIFQRLRADTKGYASPLPHSHVFEYSPSPSLSARMNLPRQASPVGQASQLPAPQSSQHWAPGRISDWTNDIHQGSSDAWPAHDHQHQPQSVPQHRVPRPLPSPPVPQPPAPTNHPSFPQQPHQYPTHGHSYHAPPPFHQPQYSDNQPWPMFAPAMHHPPPPFPPQYHPAHQHRLQYHQQQPAYHSTFNYGTAPNFPMPLMG